MQSRSFSFASSFVALIATALLVFAQGCTTDTTNHYAEPTSDSLAPTRPSGGESSSQREEDAAIPRDPLYRGSPLCRVTAGLCMPDDQKPNCKADPSGDGRLQACRITDGDSAEEPVLPACERGNAQGVDGVACKKGEDCSAGFDCVEEAGGSFCRRYCCMGSCKEQRSQNGGETFCDVQKIVGQTPHKAPVCMALKPCILLTAGQCGEKETCSIVTEQGQTGCVVNGNAQAGDSCEEEHCDSGLTCLGTPGNRACYQLCKTDGSVPCAPSQVCKTSTLFANSADGVCKEAAALR